MMLKLLKRCIAKRTENAIVEIIPNEKVILVRLTENSVQRSCMRCVWVKDNEILIGDITHTNEKDINKGYGSKMMALFLSFAREHGCRFVYGNLSENDRDHKERLDHFYSKFGFNIIEYPNPQDSFYGKIELALYENELK